MDYKNYKNLDEGAKELLMEIERLRKLGNTVVSKTLDGADKVLYYDEGFTKHTFSPFDTIFYE